MISPSGPGELVKTKQTRKIIDQVRVTPPSPHYVIEVVYKRAAQQAELNPALFRDLGFNNLAVLTSDAGNFAPFSLMVVCSKVSIKSTNLARKVLPTAPGPGIEASAVQPRRLAV